MTKKGGVLLCLVVNLFVYGQKDSISIVAKLNNNELIVKQKITYYNKSNQNLNQLKLLNAAAAYKNRETALLKRKLEDRKTDLYYAEKKEQGQLNTLQIDGQSFAGNLNAENIYINIPSLAPGKSISLSLEYSLQIPSAQFTGYGMKKDEALLKYFFLVPDSFDYENAVDKNYIDIEETNNVDTFYTIDFSSASQNVSSNLEEISPKIFQGILNEDVEIYLSNRKNYKTSIELEGEKHTLEFGYDLSEDEHKYLEFYLPLQLRFIKERTGFLPKKIFVSQKFKTKNDFFGNDDIKFWKLKFQLFTDSEKVDLDYISIISQKISDQIFVTSKYKDHWITNGLKTYIEIQYLEKFYKDYKLLGSLPDYKFLGINPIKYTHAAKLKLSDRYGLPYQYIMVQNLDQKIGESFQLLSNFNEFAVSKFEMGTLFNFVSEKMGSHYFDEFLKGYIEKNRNKVFEQKDFLNQLAICSGYSSEFLEEYMQHKNRVNFKLKSFKNFDNNIHIKVAKNSSLNIPFKLETINNNGEKSTYWYDTNSKQSPHTYVIPDNNIKKITINDHYIFPESNFRDNYLYTKGLFSNTKKIKFKLFTDTPSPEYNEIYVAPKFSWNNYDKFLIGMKFQNKSLFDRPFLYSIMPFYSSGTKTFTGSFSASYKIQPAESFYRTLFLGVASSYFHYDYDLSYKKITVSATMTLNKNPRSQIGRNIVTSYNYFERELSKEMILNDEYSKYNIWNVGFIYSESNVIKDKYLFGNLQLMEDFQKISAESYYRWEYARNKKLSLRFFGGIFINNNTRNNMFNLGISRVSNYSFSYNLLAQSASTGLLSQQFILAEGGFKSFINGTVNQWMLSTNLDTHVWKMFNIYADAGLYKNRNQNPKFIWDSGIKLKVIPDFLEVYFPVQSSLGFEPGFKDYGSRIRYTLSFNLNSVIGYFRRGWY